MNPQDPLAALQPLRQPEMIGWWPPAPGWWLLLTCTLLALAALVFLLLRRHRRNAYRRAALAQLQQLQSRYPAPEQAREHLAAINALLKAAALHAYGAPAVAAQFGHGWQQFLDTSVKPGPAFTEAFASAPYLKRCPELDLDAVHSAARHWIKHHRVSL